MILKHSLVKFLKTGAIPLLLITVAVRQIVLVNTAGLSPWHGGGFGMFASMDRDERRVVTAQLECESIQGVSLPGLLANAPELVQDKTYIHISTFPTDAQLQRLGKLLTEDTGNITGLTDGLNECGETLQLQAWRLIYKDGAIGYKPITQPVEVIP
ncbi:MAG: hypothetical protein AAF821_11895 [Cyanobacteria bacterium P01_D01_bin.156]